MLERVMDFIHNYFVKMKFKGRFHIENGTLNCKFLKKGQFYKIVGSTFNDAVHIYPSYDLVDEDFFGEVWAMAVPPTFIALCQEIEDWQTKYGEASMSPYTSESFGGYAYTKASGAGSSAEQEPSEGWQAMFRTQLNHWRKVI